MKTYEELEAIKMEMRQKLEQNRQRQNQIDKEFSDKRKEIKRKTHDFPAEVKALLTEFERLSKDSAIMEMEFKLMRTNAKHAFFAEIMPKIVDILKKYTGKKFGTKTEEKFRTEVHDALGVWCTVIDEYGFNKLIITYGINNYERIDVYTVCDTEAGGRKEVLSSENKVLPVTVEDFKLADCGEYVEDTHSRTMEIIEANDRFCDMVDKLNEAARAYTEVSMGLFEYACLYDTRRLRRIDI